MTAMRHYLFFLILIFSSSAICNGEQSEEVFKETHHEVVIEGKKIPYRAVAGNFILRDEAQKPIGNLFWVSYSRDELADQPNRPVTFCFNGGPGASSVWLNLGLLGPKKIQVTEKREAIPPYQLVDNPLSLLDVTDLVFIDPISTGYSYAIPNESAKKFHGVEEDTKVMAEAIRLYLEKYNRWNSPKYLLGESYGTLRAVTLASYLHNNAFIYLNGVILISSVLSFNMIDFDLGNDLPYLLFLPSYTATAWYHKKLPSALQGDLFLALDQSKAFAAQDYAAALFKGDSLPAEQKNSIAEKLSSFTGLSSEYILNANLRVDFGHFAKELLRDQQRTVGRFDSRFEGIDGDGIGSYIEYDPSLNNVLGAFTAAYTQYLKSDLNWNSDLPYYSLRNLDRWDYGKDNQYKNVLGILRNLMSKSRRLNIFVASGYYDLATPFFGTQYTFNHLGLDPSLIDQITLKYYQGGHMMYTNPSVQVQLRKDLLNFYH